MKYIISLSLAFSFSTIASAHLSMDRVEDNKQIKLLKKLTDLQEKIPSPKPIITPKAMIKEGMIINEGGGSMGGGGGGGK